MKPSHWCSAALLCAFSACAPPPPLPARSSTLALAADDRTLWVVNQDADSVSVLDVVARRLLGEVPLGPTPAVDGARGRYEPAVRPRALTLSRGKVYVAGQSANRVFVLDAAGRRVLQTLEVGAEPTAVVGDADGQAVYVVSHQAATVARIDPRTDHVTATLPVGEHPFGASLSADGATLYVSHLLRGAGVTVIDTRTLTVRGVVALADEPASDDKRVPNGTPRGVYLAAPRPGGGELWLPHLLLAVGTAQPDLDFESTVFPTISTVGPEGPTEGRRLLFQPLDPPGHDGAFTDVVSGPRDVAFTPDGSLGLILDSASEDLLVLDGETGNQRGLVRPLPAYFPEGIVVARDGRHAYVEGRSSHDVTVLSIRPEDRVAPVVVDGPSIDRLSVDPMPAELRLGQRLFYSANSAEYPISRNFWVACASCHLEGGTDAVTWRFTVGPRDTPSNAGGPINTGFLLRQALRNRVVQYDSTINLEQGGAFHRDDPRELPLLLALEKFVNFAIPFPENPHRSVDGTIAPAVLRGRTLFNERCAGCHAGEYLSDSGDGNPSLDLAGPIALHDVGTCVRGAAFDDREAPDEVDGKMHSACDFDTPTLRAVFATAPYFHDGSAATLREAVDRLPASNGLSDEDRAALVAYLETL